MRFRLNQGCAISFVLLPRAVSSGHHHTSVLGRWRQIEDCMSFSGTHPHNVQLVSHYPCHCAVGTTVFMGEDLNTYHITIGRIGVPSQKLGLWFFLAMWSYAKESEWGDEWEDPTWSVCEVHLVHNHKDMKNWQELGVGCSFDMQRVLEFGAQLLSSGGQVSVKLHHPETVNCGEQTLFLSYSKSVFSGC